MKIEDIQQLISDVVEIEKKAHVKSKTPDYNAIYATTVDMAKDLSVHANGDKPYKLFEQNAPNETDVQRKFREHQFQPTTKQTWHKALTTVNRIYNDTNYTIDEWKDEDIFEERSSKEYFRKNYPVYGDILTFYNSVRTPVKFWDANAVQCLKPRKLPTKLDDNGDLITDDTQLIEPIAIIYKSWQVVEYKEESHLLVKLEEKSWVDHGHGKVKEGNIFEFYDDINIWRITQVGRKSDNTYQYEIYYTHNLGYLPVEKLGGVPERIENEVIYRSYFEPALADLNDALYDESTLRIGKVSSIYPERWEVAERCNENGCNNGKILEDGEFIDCPTCEGTGAKPHPLNTFQIFLADRLNNPDANVPTPPVGYVQKDIATVEFLRKEINQKKEDAFANLNIDVSNKPTVTATESKIDREELFSFLLKIAQEEFGSLAWTISTLGKMRYGNSYEPPVIREPREFSVRSHEELTEELKAAREAKIPMVAFKKLLDEYHLARFNGDKRMTEITDLVFFADRLIMLTDEEMTKQVQLGYATKLDAIIHTSIYTFIERLMNEDENFFELDILEQSNLIKGQAQLIVSELTSNTQNILDVINANA